jgi:bifunctional N-acetylglutamate synthase/kinase
VTDPTELSPREVVLRFLASIGRPAEAAQYLRVFQEERAEQFAVIHVSDAIASDGLDGLVAGLRFLAQLDLRPVLVFGVVTPRGARRAAERVGAALAPLAATVARPEDAAAITRGGGIACVPLLEDKDGDRDEDGRFDALTDLVTALGTTKLIFLGRRSGLQPTGGAVVSIVDVTVDLPELDPRLPATQRKLLRQVARTLARVPHRLTVSVTSPLDLLRELFTVKGAGTLVRRGSRVERKATWSELDAPRMVAVIEEAFGRPLVPGFAGRPFAAAYVADDYRGAAIVDGTALAPYLSKFAVTTVARGEGVGRDLWRAIAADWPRLYWRSRADNPITSWYREQCDGLHRFTLGKTAWVALWRGLAPAEIPAAIDYCMSTPPDFT